MFFFYVYVGLLSDWKHLLLIHCLLWWQCYASFYYVLKGKAEPRPLNLILPLHHGVESHSESPQVLGSSWVLFERAKGEYCGECIGIGVQLKIMKWCRCRIERRLCKRN